MAHGVCMCNNCESVWTWLCEIFTVHARVCVFVCEREFECDFNFDCECDGDMCEGCVCVCLKCVSVT